MTTWFTSDHHFGHARIIELCDRPFADVDHMNLELFQRFVEVVVPEDETFFLGDIAMGKRDKTLAIVDALPGAKHLIVGNHDGPFDGRSSASKVARETAQYLEVFDTVETSGLLMVAGRRVKLNHFPYTGNSHEFREGTDRYAAHRPHDEGNWLLCGHVHEAWKVKDFQINVGVDVWNYYPVSERQIGKLMDEVEGV